MRLLFFRSKPKPQLHCYGCKREGVERFDLFGHPYCRECVRTVLDSITSVQERARKAGL